MNYINITAKKEALSQNSPNLPFRLLGEYAADKKHDFEKAQYFWAVNCLSGSTLDDLHMINQEIEWTQQNNTRVKATKTLHLAFSLPSSEELSEDAWREADQLLADTLGLQELQRVVALHNDTNNWHLHIAYNLIHPETLKKHYPLNDFKLGADVCRFMEQKYGLRRDVGFREAKHNDTRSNGVKDMEAHTWHQSFESFVLEQKKPLLDALAKARNWQDVHQAFAQHDLKLKKRANGLVIAQGKRHIKASVLDRSCSKNALEKRFGQFEQYADQRPNHATAPQNTA